MKKNTSNLGRRNAPWRLLTLMSLLAMPFSAQAYLCSATQASPDALPLLDAQCPIGHGHWRSEAPAQQNSSYFWIQCGLLKAPLTLAQAKPLYQNMTTDVWMKPEGDDFRCLIGPYEQFTAAKQDLAKVKQVPGYQDAFIRVAATGANAAKANASKASIKVPPKTERASSAKARQSVSVPSISAVAAVMPAAPKAPTAPKAPAPASLAAMPPPAESATANAVQIRLKTVLQGHVYAVPYLQDNQHEFYMEHSKPWNRLDYAAALVVCQEVEMRLPTEQEFTVLLGSQLMQKEHWPMHLPYWGEGRTGLFADGRALTLTGSSLLNVLCVR
ncbi:SPOR domain-containing protein [Vibrio sp. SM6]|uniref:SPOR domain-containing protein n=1 Tax=Vibrio agarilyticus TaxID=2726741 RepID=A0A7X8YHT8_9VIBR|nr:SPOR domain-containing protein [Vibrio agarilyticus]NLS14438.1 SPOR domain-containing protein [Vibrio agarilyticus]